MAGIPAALVDSLSNDQLACRIDAAVSLAAAECFLDRYAGAESHADCALTLGRGSGQGEVFLTLDQALRRTLGRIWFVRGKLGDPHHRLTHQSTSCPP